MTIGIMIECTDGIVMGCDGRAVYDGLIMPGFATKLSKVGAAKNPMWILGAGKADYIVEAHKKSTPTQVSSYVRELKDEEDDSALEFLLHYKGKGYMVEGSGYLCPVSPYRLIGAGAVCGEALASHLFSVRVSCDEASPQVAGFLARISEVHPLCGPPFEVRVFRDRGF